MNRAPRIEIPREAMRFAECARRYCALIGEHERTPIRRLLAESHELLTELYWLALRLPDVDPDDGSRAGRMSHAEWGRLYRSLGRRLGTRDHYMEVFNAYDRRDRASLVGSLADDFADVLRDLRHGLDAWEAGNRAYAIFHWRYLGETHWGEHATSAVRALHWLRENHDYGPPPPMPPDTARKVAGQKPIRRAPPRPAVRRSR